jgi:alkylated DNA repair dioxygenase AlkB
MDLISEMIGYLDSENYVALKKANSKFSFLTKHHPTKVYSNYCDIPGLWYIEDYLDAEEVKKVESEIAKMDFFGVSYTTKSRRVCHFGYEYQYKSPILIACDPIPDLFSTIISRLPKITGIQFEPEQVIINEYLPGQGISPHIDHIKLFGDCIASLTIGSEATIKFELNKLVKTVKPIPGSLYIMTHDARWKWKHSLRNTSKKTRYSVTYRTVNKNM